jgi:alpha-L-fucosidase
MIYLHVLLWPDGLLKLPDIRAKIVSAKLLHGGKADVRQTGGEIEISVAPAERDASDTVIALKLDSDALKIPAVAVPSQPTQHPP